MQNTANPDSFLSVKGFYAGKVVLLSGVTGFVGKVLLEKLMRSCPDIKKFYIMVRPKRNKRPMDRIKNEILSSPMFRLCKKANPDFISWAEQRIVPIQGDLVIEGLGMSAEDRRMIIEDCNVIMNSAASVNFDDPLQEAL